MKSATATLDSAHAAAGDRIASTVGWWLGASLRWITIALVLSAAGLFGMGLREYADGNGGLWRSATAALNRTLQLLPLAHGPAPDGQPPSRRPDTAPRQGDAPWPSISFTYRPDGTLHAAGKIDQGAVLRLQAALDSHDGRVVRLSLNSPGGALDDAIAMARVLRRKGVATVVEDGAICASSCPLVMAGGITRKAQKGAVVAVHQFYLAASADANPARIMADTQLTTARISRHLERMGVDPALWLHALATPPRALYYLSPAELRRYDLTTR